MFRVKQGNVFYINFFQMVEAKVCTLIKRNFQQLTTI